MDRKLPTFREVFDREERGEFKDWSEFDSALWGAACNTLGPETALSELPNAFIVYYATRALEWEVGNGGLRRQR